MKQKPKLALCALISLIGIVFSVFFSTVLHGILSGNMAKVTFPGFTLCIQSIAMDRRHFLLFLCLVCLSFLIGAMFYFTNKRPYQSDLVSITSAIQTPVPVGQHQHGSARWLTEKEIQEVFPWFTIDPNDLAEKR